VTYFVRYILPTGNSTRGQGTSGAGAAGKRVTRSSRFPPLGTPRKLRRTQEQEPADGNAAQRKVPVSAPT